jgi:hypothetical protein
MTVALIINYNLTEIAPVTNFFSRFIITALNGAKPS